MIEIYGIPTCNSCKKARTWCTQHEIDFTWQDLRKEPPSIEQVKAWVQSLSAKPLRNTSGGSYRALGEEKKEWSDTQWTEAFAADPMLLKRPILVVDSVAQTTGFRAEAWEALLL
ncbi:MAG: arsenate reductase family protein [Myxococcota bacterium]